MDLGIVPEIVLFVLFASFMFYVAYRIHVSSAKEELELYDSLDEPKAFNLDEDTLLVDVEDWLLEHGYPLIYEEENTQKLEKILSKSPLIQRYNYENDSSVECVTSLDKRIIIGVIKVSYRIPFEYSINTYTDYQFVGLIKLPYRKHLNRRVKRILKYFNISDTHLIKYLRNTPISCEIHNGKCLFKYNKNIDLEDLPMLIELLKTIQSRNM